MHFDKKNDCVQHLINAVPNYRRRDYITFYYVNFFLLTNKTNEVDSHIFHQVY